jgi:hypothetical protein
MKARDFDKKFDEGVDITDALDLSKARRPLQAQRRVNVDFPAWMIDSLDREASKLGVTRQSVIKIWLAERLESRADRAKTAADHNV